MNLHLIHCNTQNNSEEPYLEVACSFACCSYDTISLASDSDNIGLLLRVARDGNIVS